VLVSVVLKVCKLNTADYAIAQFRFLERLTLVHGRYSYKRLSRLINFSFHKNIIFTVPQILFIIVSCWSGTLYQGNLSGLFNVLFASLPILGLGIWEQDLPEKLVLQYPAVYRSGQAGQSFNYLRFFWSMVSAVVQGIFIFVACVVLFRHDMVGPSGYLSGFVSVGLLAYTVVIVVVTLKVAIMLHSWTWFNVFFNVISIIFWFVIAIVAPRVAVGTFFDIEYALDFWLTEEAANFWFFVFSVTFLCLVLDWAFKMYKRSIDPETFHLIQNLSFEPAGLRRKTQSKEALCTPLTPRL